MGAGVIRFGKTQLAAGLFWQAAPTVAAALREGRIVAGKGQLNCDLLSLRRQGMPQFGLGRKAVGHRAGMPAVAVALANSVDCSSWLGLFAVNRQWLLVMVRKGAILPDGDQLFDSEEDARQALDCAATAGWDRLFAPAGWAVTGAQPGTLSDLLGKNATDGRLREVAGRPWRPALGGLLVAGGGTILWAILYPNGADLPGSQSVIPGQPIPVPPPWQGAPSPRGVIADCQRAIETAATMPGFEIDSVSCDGRTRKIIYRRRWGTLDWLPEAAVPTTPDLVALSNPLAASGGARQGGEVPWTADQLRRYLWGASQSFRLSSDIASPAVEKSLEAGREMRSGPTLRSVALSVAGPLPANALARVLGVVPALVVEEVGWRASQWTVKGKAYVR